MTSVSGHWMHFVSKIRQTVAGITMTSQFHDFFGSSSWRVFAVWNHCVATAEYYLPLPALPYWQN